MIFPWLISRRKLIFSCLLEIMLIYILNILLFSNYFIFNENINIFSFTFIPFWLLFSYIIGRYSYRDYIFRNKKVFLFLKLFLKTFLVSIFSLMIVLLIYLNINLNNFNHFDKLIFQYSIIISFLLNFIQFPLILRFLENTSKADYWLFIGSKELYDLISKELSWSRKEFRILYSDLDAKLSKINLRQFEGIVSDKFEEMKYQRLNKLLLIKDKGTKVETIEKWCEKYLQRFPPEIISNEYLISGNFKIDHNSIQFRIKRLGDLLVSLILLLFSIPIIIISCILIFIEDQNNIFYKQDRVGINQSIFTIYKLRTMRPNSESDNPRWASKSDNRITKVGTILRKYRIDELPQLISVIKGEMSLIGPRPERYEIDKKLEKLIPHYNTRYLTRPGLSGWAQVNYPYCASVEDSKKKLSYDLFYLRNFSIWFDFLILFKTIKLVILKKGSEPI
tara:strand:- start:12822 stop:14168 length:1347 start_codon:yes stop_codon:yes gene_type:complete